MQRPPEEIGLWPEHGAAVEAFLAVSSQWRCHARFGAGPLFLGLDYQAAEAGWRMADIQMTPDLFTQVQLIEAGAVQTLNEAR